MTVPSLMMASALAMRSDIYPCAGAGYQIDPDPFIVIGLIFICLPQLFGRKGKDGSFDDIVSLTAGGEDGMMGQSAGLDDGCIFDLDIREAITL
jgi:hypothetical protein